MYGDRIYAAAVYGEAFNRGLPQPPQQGGAGKLIYGAFLYGDPGLGIVGGEQQPIGAEIWFRVREGTKNL